MDAEAAMAEKSREFRDKGGEIYLRERNERNVSSEGKQDSCSAEGLIVSRETLSIRAYSEQAREGQPTPGFVDDARC
jgi:hypothetical protein